MVSRAWWHNPWGVTYFSILSSAYLRHVHICVQIFIWRFRFQHLFAVRNLRQVNHLRSLLELKVGIFFSINFSGGLKRSLIILVGLRRRLKLLITCKVTFLIRCYHATTDHFLQRKLKVSPCCVFRSNHSFLKTSPVELLLVSVQHTLSHTVNIS